MLKQFSRRDQRPNKAPHLTAILLRYMAAGELCLLGGVSQGERRWRSCIFSYKNKDALLAKAPADQLEALERNVVYNALALESGYNRRDVHLRAPIRSDAAFTLLTGKALHTHFVMGEIGAACVLHTLRVRRPCFSSIDRQR